MRESAMATADVAASTTTTTTRLMCKRVTVVVWALAHLTLTFYVLRVMLFDGESNALADCVSPAANSGSPPAQVELTEQQRAHRTAAMEFRRQAAPLLLILRVKDIEAELVQTLQDQAQGGKQVVDTLEVDSSGDAARSAVPGDVPEKCHPEANVVYGGVAVRWGLTFHVDRAAECCSACAKQAAYARGSRELIKCNVWVFCPVEKGCPSPDGYHHKRGECWLKHSSPDHVKVVGDYSAVTGKKSPPLPVLWISGVIPSA